jgi:hypothetical protein
MKSWFQGFINTAGSPAVFQSANVGKVYLVLISDYGEKYVWKRLGPITLDKLPELGLSMTLATSGGPDPEAYGAGFFGVYDTIQMLGAGSPPAKVLFVYDSFPREDMKYTWQEQLSNILGTGAEFTPLWNGGSTASPDSNVTKFNLEMAGMLGLTDFIYKTNYYYKYGEDYCASKWKDIIDEYNGAIVSFPCHALPDEVYELRRATKKTTTWKVAEELGTPADCILTRHKALKSKPAPPAFLFSYGTLHMAMQIEPHDCRPYYRVYNKPRVLIAGERFAVLERPPESLVEQYAPGA